MAETDAPEVEEDSLFEAPPLAEQERMVEAILFATAEPVSVAELNGRMPHGCNAAEALALLTKRYEGRGVSVKKVGDGWAMRTASDLSFLMQKETVETRKLSRAAIETLRAMRLGTLDYLLQHRPGRFLVAVGAAEAAPVRIADVGSVGMIFGTRPERDGEGQLEVALREPGLVLRLAEIVQGQHRD